MADEKFWHYTAAEEITRLRRQNQELREALKPVHNLAAEIMIAHEAIMAVWRDKASPDIIASIERMREELFAASKVARAVLASQEEKQDG